ncbi:MAG: hypothetical protein H9W81_03380 [Enterococcus sp.]|nr:hypothetical protein [Enterococcus sp.]
MCIAGGKRCEYADALSNVRKKVRNRMKGAYSGDIDNEISKELGKFHRENPDLVKAHLPDRMGFQWNPPAWDVPERAKSLLGDIKEPVRGVEKQSDLYSSLTKRNEEWEENMTMDEKNAMIQYTMSAFESINPYLRRKGFSEWAKKNGHLHRSEGGVQKYVEDVIKPRIAAMDSAMRRAVKPETPDTLYRFYRVPAGITPREYIKKYFKPGTGFKDKGFVSTSADPEYVAAHIMDREGKRNSNYIVLEMVSDSGASLHNAPEYSGRVQDVESEVLLPRNTGMRIMETGTRTFGFAKKRADLERRFRVFGGSSIDFDEDSSIKVPVVRMIDESLIRRARHDERADEATT